MQGGQDAPQTVMLQEIVARQTARDTKLIARLTAETARASQQGISPAEAMSVVEAIALALERWAVETIAAVEYDRSRIAATFAANADVPPEVTDSAIQDAILMQVAAQERYRTENMTSHEEMRTVFNGLPSTIPELSTALKRAQAAVDARAAEGEFIDEMYSRQIAKLRAILTERGA